MKKNLLYIFADQWRAQAISYANEDYIHTPNMDEFAKESCRVKNAISTYPLCSPHRASLLTGKYPLNCGFWTNCKTGVSISPTLSPQETTISDVLKHNGYNTAYIGKWHLDASTLNYKKKEDTYCEGWDCFTPKGERRHNFDFWHSYGAMDKHLTPHYWEDDETPIIIDKWSAEHETDILLDYLNNQKNQEAPFFAMLSWNPPHPPYDQIPKKYLDLFENKYYFRKNVSQEWKNNKENRKAFKEYFAAIIGLDEQFGRIMKYLKENNLYDNTTIVLSSDHGDCMGSHNRYGKNIWYEEAINIPFYIKDESITLKECDALFESCDHSPTLLDLLNIDIPNTMDGKSIKPLLMNQEYNEKEFAFLCMIPGMPDLIDPYLKKGLNPKGFGFRGLRTKEFTYIIDNKLNPNENQIRYFYDNKNDKYQLNPKIIKKNDEICTKLDPILKEFCICQKDFFIFDKEDQINE
ncbi:MAG: sulfatase [Spirochaetia bacterium]|nr:sulfatase [Spirochaetia bacterium]